MALAVPPLAVLVRSAMWLPGLPDDVAFHWNAAGRVDGTFPASPLLWLAIIGASLGLLGGLVLLSPTDQVA